MFPEDLSPVSSSSDDDNFCKFQYFPNMSNNRIDSSSDSSHMFTQESITWYHPNVTIARIPFKQLVYFLKRYLKSVECNPTRPEWPVHGMDKNQNRHFTCKVEDYKLQNHILYHLHAYTEIVKGFFLVFFLFHYTAPVFKKIIIIIKIAKHIVVIFLFQIVGLKSSATSKSSSHLLSVHMLELFLMPCVNPLTQQVVILDTTEHMNTGHYY